MHIGFHDVTADCIAGGAAPQESVRVCFVLVQPCVLQDFVFGLRLYEWPGSKGDHLVHECSVRLGLMSCKGSLERMLCRSRIGGWARGVGMLTCRAAAAASSELGAASGAVLAYDTQKRGRWVEGAARAEGSVLVLGDFFWWPEAADGRLWRNLVTAVRKLRRFGDLLRVPHIGGEVCCSRLAKFAHRAVKYMYVRVRGVTKVSAGKATWCEVVYVRVCTTKYS